MAIILRRTCQTCLPTGLARIVTLLMFALITILIASFGATPLRAEQTPALAITFDEAVQQIVSRSTGVNTQLANLEALRARNLPIRLAFLPTVSLDARKSWSGGDQANALAQLQLEGVTHLNLFRFGADVSDWRAASQDERTQESLLRDQSLKVEDTGVKALVTYIQNELEIATLSRLADLQTRILGIARARYARGLLPQQDVDRVSIDLDNADARLADAEANRAAAQSQLTALLGLAVVRAEWPWKKQLAEVRLPTAMLAPIADRPDVQSAEFRLEAEDQRHSRDVRRYLPTLDADFTYGRYGYGTDSLSPAWIGSIGVTFPIFDHLAQYSTARAQSFVRAAAEQTLEQTRRDAQADWQTARGSFAVAVQSAIRRERTLTTSNRLYEDNLKRFQVGRLDTNDLAIDQSRLYDAELLAIQGWAAAHREYAHFCHASGRRLKDCN